MLAFSSEEAQSQWKSPLKDPVKTHTDIHLHQHAQFSDILLHLNDIMDDKSLIMLGLR